MSSAVKYQDEQTQQARIGQRDSGEAIIAAARHLANPIHRRALFCRYEHGWTIREIAESLGISKRSGELLIGRLTRLVQSREYLLMAIGRSQVPLRLHLIGECLYLSAMTLEETVEATGQSLYQVRASKRELEGLAGGSIGNDVPSYRGRRNTPTVDWSDEPGITTE